MIVLANKQDLDSNVTTEELEKMFEGSKVIKTILSDGSGVREMEESIKDMVFSGAVSQSESLMVTNVRHMDLLKNSLSAIGDAIAMTGLSEPLEIIEIDVKRAYEMLGEIIGEEVAEDIIDEVFAKFCLGK